MIISEKMDITLLAFNLEDVAKHQSNREQVFPGTDMRAWLGTAVKQ